MTDAVVTDKPFVEVILGCDPQVTVRVTEDVTGTLFVVVSPTDPTAPITDIDGIFFDLADDSTLGSLNFFPDPNTGSIFSPVTSVQAAADSVNKLDNGVQLADSFDIGIQFGTVDNSTAGEVAQANFTLFSDDGPLSIEDLDLDSFATVVDSDGGQGQILTVNDNPDGEPVMVSTEILFADFDDVDSLSEVDGVSSDGWSLRNGELFTNSHNEGTVEFGSVDAEGDVTLSFDARVYDANRFEAGGRAGDELTLEVRLDDGTWTTLDQFVVNDEGTALVGSNTGNEITSDSSTLSYSGGVLDDVSGGVEFRLVSDFTARDEKLYIDNVSVTETTEVDPAAAKGEPITVDFEGLNAGDVVGDQIDGITVSAQREGDAEGSENDAMIFDSNNPTGRDHDLEFEDQDNILIISEDNDSSDADDNAHGGSISIGFETPSQVVSLNLLDIEESGGTVDLFNIDGDLINTVDIPAAGNNSNQELAIGVEGVSSIDINLAGSGAVDDLVYIPEDDCLCDAQTDATYMNGIPMLPPVVEEETNVEEEEIYADM